MGGGSQARRQQGHRGRRRISATARCRRKVAIEAGLCRSGRTGRSCGAGSRPAARASASRGRQPGGEKRQRSATRKAYAAMHKEAWWWKPRQPRPSKWPRPSSCFSSSKSRSTRQRSFAVATSSSSVAASGRVESQYFVGSLLALGPLRQQPLLRARLAQPEVVVRRPDPHGGEARGQRPGRALAPGDGPPRARGQARGQLLGRERLVLGVAPQPLRRPAPAAPRRGRQRPRAGRPQAGRAEDAGHVGRGPAPSSRRGSRCRCRSRRRSPPPRAGRRRPAPARSGRARSPAWSRNPTSSGTPAIARRAGSPAQASGR